MGGEGLKRKEIVIALLLIALLAGAWMLISHVSDAQSGAQTRFVEDAVRNAVLTCYAVEGAYPESLEHLRENYGLAYDESRYIVSYDAFASNLLPQIFVMELEG